MKTPEKYRDAYLNFILKRTYKFVIIPRMTKHTGKYIGYFRVSTGKQSLGIEAQKAAVQNFLNGGKWKLIASFTEQESGRKADRPKLAEALRACRLHNATLIVGKLDRLARNAGFLRRIVEESGERGVAFCDLPQIPEGPAGKFLIGMMAEVAELEGAMISQRTKAALAVKAKQLAKQGKRLGTPKPQTVKKYAHLGGAASATVRRAAADKRAADLVPMIEQMREEGVTTLAAIAERLNAEGIATASGGKWWPCTVRNILKSAKVAA